MGGNALRKVNTRRVNSVEFVAISNRVRNQLKAVSSVLDAYVVPAYNSKESFGDVDVLVLVESNADLKAIAVELFNPTELRKNGNVLSFDVEQVQVDLIYTTDPSEYQFSSFYFAYNDLGNFIGRTAHRMGFKFGHNGLWYQYYDPQDSTRLVKTLLVTDNVQQALSFMDYDLGKWGNFNTPTDVFEYAETSMYFDPAAFLLNNRSYAARVRDKKRKMHSGMLEHLTKKYNLVGDETPAGLDRQMLLEAALSEFPEFKHRYEQAQEELVFSKKLKQVFNGNVIGREFGLEGVELGKAMSQLRTSMQEKKLAEQVAQMSQEQFLQFAHLVLDN
jgi:hypothetical protein